MDRLIRGAGGGGKSGGGGGGTPSEAKDSLESKAYAEVIDLLCEGEIEGFATPSRKGYTRGTDQYDRERLKDVFLDNTAILRERAATDAEIKTSDLNFKDVSFGARYGTAGQTAFDRFSDIKTEYLVDTTVESSVPITRTITDTDTDAVKITISVPQLQRLEDDGDIKGSSLKLRIAISENGGGFTTKLEDTIKGRTPDAYQKDYVISLAGATFPVDVRVTRLSDDSDSAKKANAFKWYSYTEITRDRLRYPSSALAALRISAEQFSRIPQRSYRIRGRKVAIPNGVTVSSSNGRIIYPSGFVWDGTFAAAQWTSDPAWCLWDLLTNGRFGFGDHISSAQLDKWAFLAASQYASALVPDGFGSNEPRFSCNVNIQTDDDAYKLINQMCSVMRCMPYWSVGALTISQDKPQDPAYLFTLANVSEEGFTYQSSSQRTRPTVAIVSYLDLEAREVAYEQVEDQDGIAKFGVITAEIDAFACTSRGQAQRIGEWLLYSGQYETEVVTFRASIDAGVIVRPGQVINISDPVRAGARRGGRISAATTTTVTVDAVDGLPASGGTLSVILPDGTVQSRSVSSRSGAVITVASAFSQTPNANSIWTYDTSTLQTSTWRVLSVQEEDQAQYTITALTYNSSKYDYIERDKELQFRDVTNLNELPDSPTNLTATETLYESNGKALSKIIVSWRTVVGVDTYTIRWREGDSNWSSATIQRPDYEILDSTAGSYEIEVYSVSGSGKQSANPAELYFDAYSKTAPPADLTGVAIVPIDSASAILSWTPVTELDVRLGGKILIRHNVALAGATWENSQEIVVSASGNQTQKQVPLLEGTYLLKAEDDGGRRSVNAVSVITDLPEPQPRLLVKAYAEDQETPPFSGNVTGMLYNEELDGLIISSGDNVDDMAPDVVPGSALIDENGDPILDENGDPILAEADEGDWDSLESIDSVGGVDPSGEYEFGSTWDMGSVFDVNMRRRFVTRPYLPASLWDDKVGDIDAWPEVDETNLDGVNATLYVRSTPDNPGASPTWSAWRDFSNAILRGRAFQFKVIATSNDPNQNIVIDELGAELELQQHVQQSATLTSGAAMYAATFPKAFYQAPSVGVTAFNMATGDYFVVANVTRTGFEVTFRNSAGAAVSRNFTYTAIGYGKEI